MKILVRCIKCVVERESPILFSFTMQALSGLCCKMRHQCLHGVIQKNMELWVVSVESHLFHLRLVGTVSA